MDKILAHKAVSSNGNFLQGHPKPEFSEKLQRGTKGNFSKIAQKVVFVGKAQKHSCATGIMPKLECT